MAPYYIDIKKQKKLEKRLERLVEGGGKAVRARERKIRRLLSIDDAKRGRFEEALSILVHTDSPDDLV